MTVTTGGRRTRTRAAAAILMAALALLCGGAARASAAGWVPLPEVDAGSGGRPDVATARDGTTAAAWVTQGGGQAVVRVSVRPAGGGFEEPRTISDPAVAATGLPAVAVDDQGGVTVAWISGGTVRASYRPAGGSWPATAQVLSSTTAASPNVAVGAGGQAIVVWARDLGSNAREVEAAQRAPGAALFGGAAQVSATGLSLFGTPDVALDAAGDIAVLWQRRVDLGGGTTRDVEEVSVKTPAQTFPTTVTSLSSTTTGNASSTSYSLAMTPAGRIVAMWDYNSGSVISVWAADRPATPSFASGTWSPSASVSGAGSSGPLVAVDDAGNAQALWFGPGGMLAALRPAFGAFTSALLSATSSYRALATSPSGDAFALWSTSSATTIVASRRATGAGFADPVPLASVAAPGVVYGPGVGVDDQGNAFVVYARSEAAGSTVDAAAYDAAAPALTAVSVPASATAGQAIALSATAADRVSGAALHWDFGDGTAADGPSVGHAFATAGAFAVKVTATDGAGNATSATRTVVVAAAPSGGGGGTPSVNTGLPNPVGVPARIAAKWRHLSRGRTAVKALSVTGAKAGDTIKVSCSGGGCKPVLKKAKTLKPKTVKKGTVSLLGTLKALKLRPKARLTIAISRKGYRSIAITYTMVEGKDPKRTQR